jgi:hypothetical protein
MATTIRLTTRRIVKTQRFLKLFDQKKMKKTELITSVIKLISTLPAFLFVIIKEDIIKFQNYLRNLN